MNDLPKFICIVKGCLMEAFETQLGGLTTWLCDHHRAEAGDCL